MPEFFIISIIAASEDVTVAELEHCAKKFKISSEYDSLLFSKKEVITYLLQDWTREKDVEYLELVVGIGDFVFKKK